MNVEGIQLPAGLWTSNSHVLPDQLLNLLSKDVLRVSSSQYRKIFILLVSGQRPGTVMFMPWQQVKQRKEEMGKNISE